MWFSECYGARVNSQAVPKNRVKFNNRLISLVQRTVPNLNQTNYSFPMNQSQAVEYLCHKRSLIDPLILL